MYEIIYLLAILSVIFISNYAVLKLGSNYYNDGKEIELFDIYEKIELVDASYSLGLKIIFRSKQKTLLKNEIDFVLTKVKNIGTSL